MVTGMHVKRQEPQWPMPLATWLSALWPAGDRAVQQVPLASRLAAGGSSSPRSRRSRTTNNRDSSAHGAELRSSPWERCRGDICRASEPNIHGFRSARNNDGGRLGRDRILRRLSAAFSPAPTDSTGQPGSAHEARRDRKPWPSHVATRRKGTSRPSAFAARRRVNHPAARLATHRGDGAYERSAAWWKGKAAPFEPDRGIIARARGGGVDDPTERVALRWFGWFSGYRYGSCAVVQRSESDGVVTALERDFSAHLVASHKVATIPVLLLHWFRASRSRVIGFVIPSPW